MNSGLKRGIGRLCSGLGIPLFGCAPAERWQIPHFEPWVPEKFYPASIVPETKTVIVIGMPVSLPAVETSPSIWYHEEYRTVNTLLDTNAHRIAAFLNNKGYASVALPRDGYGHISVLKKRPLAFFSHRHAAFLAGLGNFGVNNVLLTREFGPRVRFTSVFTAAEIPPDPLMKAPLCIRCMRCVGICPVHAIPGNDYPDGLTNKRACASRSEELLRHYVSPCGFCIKVCPVGEDRKLYRRETVDIYDEREKKYGRLHRAWRHVRNYGGGGRAAGIANKTTLG
jgi:epoxyqueuosine reductase QueG